MGLLYAATTPESPARTTAPIVPTPVCLLVALEPLTSGIIDSVSDTTTPPALPSGRFLLRLPRALHAALRRAAREAGLSLNDYCARRLAAPVPSSGHADLAAVVDRASDLLGPSLVGIVAYGSWARGEPTDHSDVDLLVVVDAEFPLTRQAYRAWDAQPLTVDGRPAEVHLVRLPGPSAQVTGIWAEAAIDGHVVVERGFVLSTRLASVRRALLGGRLQRRSVHGQPYWTEVACA